MGLTRTITDPFEKSPAPSACCPQFSLLALGIMHFSSPFSSKGARRPKGIRAPDLDNLMNEKICTVCKQLKPLNDFNLRPDRDSGYRSECKKCQYERQYKRERNNRPKVNAKHMARLATKRGILQRPLFCQICGNPGRLERHHPDYKKPLYIIWVHRKCHCLITKGKIAC